MRTHAVDCYVARNDIQSRSRLMKEKHNNRSHDATRRHYTHHNVHKVFSLYVSYLQEYVFMNISNTNKAQNRKMTAVHSCFLLKYILKKM